MFRTYSVLLACVLALLTQSTRAQDAQQRALYGRGVHEYYNGNFKEAIRYLTIPIEKNTDDPRVYYFRGLANGKIGRTEASLADLQKGADLEARDKRGVYQISAALQRIQGKPRLQIEQLRRAARVNLAVAEQARLKARYEQQQANEAAVLRKPATTAPAIPTDAQTNLHSGNPFTPSNIAGVKSNPKNVTVSKISPRPGIDDKDPLGNVLAGEPANQPVATSPTAPPPGNKPAATTPPAGNNPFAPGNAATTPPAGNNPFAPGNKPAATTPPAGNNPAATTPPAGNNPFAPGNKPAATTPPAGNNPFAPGNAATTPPAGNNPAATTPPADNKSGGTLGAIFRSFNPFSGGGGSDKPADDNPDQGTKTTPEPGTQTPPTKPGSNPFGTKDNPFDN